MSQMKVDSASASQVNFQQDDLNAAAAKQGQKSAINDAVKDVKEGQAQRCQVRRSAGYITGRVILGIVTVGISEIGFAIANKVKSNARQNALEQPVEKNTLEQQKGVNKSSEQNKAEVMHPLIRRSIRSSRLVLLRS